ncbi:putative neutral zinc metallopeptidase [Corynebacterium lowii]|uniref:Putative neutral zinc metallopeptidase n=1 Tax=Corynebacterium lowii TaxID=1544413 RepID=A0A0Q0UGW3_9CORY|nr:putative neutral zinc metallopeptidase [Corynebacterium lowii]MDP9851157.1 putative metalloprotease [Corynebacterium lowii]
MTFRNDASFDSGRASSSSGGGRGGLIAGGGVGTLVLVGLYLVLGGNPSDLGNLLGQGGGTAERDTGDYSLEHCQTAEDANANDDCRMVATASTIDEVWASVLPEQAGIEYTEPGLHLFRSSVNTGCGAASSSTGYWAFLLPRGSNRVFGRILLRATTFPRWVRRAAGADVH